MIVKGLRKSRYDEFVLWLKSCRFVMGEVVVVII